MSDAGDAEPRSALTVARVGGGRSARVGALVVVGVLVAVVWLGVSGRPPSPPVTPESPQLAVAGPTSEPAAVPVATADASPRPTAGPADSYSVSATIGSHSHLAVLEEIRPGYMLATLRVPFPPEATEGTLEIAQLRVNDVAENTIAVNDWVLPLGPLASVSGEPGVVIDAYVPARPNLRNESAAVRSGYHLIVHAQNDLLFGLLSIEMTLGNGLSAPVAVASANGLSVVPQPPPFADPGTRPRPRYSNECRWEAPIPPSPSGPADEASC